MDLVVSVRTGRNGTERSETVIFGRVCVCVCVTNGRVGLLDGWMWKKDRAGRE